MSRSQRTCLRETVPYAPILRTAGVHYLFHLCYFYYLTAFLYITPSCTCIYYWQARSACKHIRYTLFDLKVFNLDYLWQHVGGGPKKRGRPTTAGVLRDASTTYSGESQVGTNPHSFWGKRCVTSCTLTNTVHQRAGDRAVDEQVPRAGMGATTGYLNGAVAGSQMTITHMGILH